MVLVIPIIEIGNPGVSRSEQSFRKRGTEKLKFIELAEKPLMAES